ncbi:MAG: non-canonical purine NTP pyrophosphatase [Thermodesulfatator sp.]|nr:MAG: non-canonical purine NTP pyrophosphatase [Thermodesulfatator sp.]
MRIVLATRNRGKVSELQALLSDLGLEIISMDQAGDLPEIIEDGLTFQDNATKKAMEVARATGLMAIADDSGLEVDALGGRPGVFSARYAGENASDEENYLKLLQEMEGIDSDQRTARFRCVMVACTPEGECVVSHGTCEGSITTEPRGSQGFGYDPVFVPAGDRRTMAELTRQEKNRISHRGKALEALKKKLEDFIRRFQSHGHSKKHQA